MGDLKDKAVDIKGKAYVLVKDRVLEFHRLHENGSIETGYVRVDSCYEFYAKITPDIEKPMRYFTGHSQATIGDGHINKTSAMENAETSAVGRAFAFMGIGVIDSIASVDEINKAQGSTGKQKEQPTYPDKNFLPATELPDATGMTLDEIRSILNPLGLETVEQIKTAGRDKVIKILHESIKESL
jgi:hypothetical protein